MAASTAARNPLHLMRRNTARQKAEENILMQEDESLRAHVERFAHQYTQHMRHFQVWQVARQRLRPFLGVSGLVVGLLGVIACGGDATAPTLSTTPKTVYAFKFQWPAINLALTAPYDTVQLTTTFTSSSGGAVTDTSTVRYVTKDSAIVVSPTGLVTARFLTNQAMVIARRTVHGVTLADTAVIQVTQTPFPAPLATLSIHPQPGGIDRAQCYFHYVQCLLPFFATIATGDPTTETLCTPDDGCTYPLLVHYASSDPTIATVDQYGDVSRIRPGHFVFTISTLAYGVHKVDSLPFSIGYDGKTTASLDIDSTQHPPIILLNNGQPRRSLYGVGMQLVIINNTDKKFLVTIPTSDHDRHGVHFTGENPGPAALIDTLPSFAEDPDRYVVFVQFDSTGTYALQYRNLQTGVTYTDSLKIYPFP